MPKNTNQMRKGKANENASKKMCHSPKLRKPERSTLTKSKRGWTLSSAIGLGSSLNCYKTSAVAAVGALALRADGSGRESRDCRSLR